MRRWDWGQLLTAAAYLLLFAVLATFAHSGLQGENGLLALRQAQVIERTLERDLVLVRAERTRLENLTRRLSEDSLDPELLDERARALLGYIRPDELVIR